MKNTKKFNKNGRTQPIFFSFENIQRISFENYVTCISNLKLKNYSDIFFQTCALASTLDKYTGAMTKNDLSKHAIASLILTIKTILEKDYPLHFSEMQKIYISQQTNDLCLIAEGISADYYFQNRAPSKLEYHMQLISYLCTNSQNQGDITHEIANTLILTGLSGFKSLSKESELVNTLFNEFNGINANHYLIIVFYLFGASLETFYFSNFYKNEKYSDIMNKVLSSLSFKLSEPLTSEIFNHAIAHSGHGKAEAIFSLRPIIQINENTFLFAGHPFLKIQCTRKFILKSLFYSRTSILNQKFSQFLGSRFESFFKELCNMWAPKYGHYDEYYWHKNENKKSADRIVFEKHGRKNIVNLFQLKSKTLLENTLFGSNYESLCHDVNTSFSEMISKSINFLWEAYNIKKNGRLNPSTQKLTEKILNSNICVLIGICIDVPPIFSNQHTRKILIDKVKQAVKVEAWDWFHSHFEKNYWHILSLHEFEIFLSLPKEKQDFHKTIFHYFRDSNLENDPISLQTGIPCSYRDHLIKTSPNKKLPMLAELADIVKSFQNEVDQFFDIQINYNP